MGSILFFTCELYSWIYIYEALTFIEKFTASVFDIKNRGLQKMSLNYHKKCNNPVNLFAMNQVFLIMIIFLGDRKSHIKL